MTAAVRSYAERLGIVVAAEDADGPILHIPVHRGLVGRPGRLHGGAIGALLEQAVRLRIEREGAAEAQMLRPCTMTVDFLRSGMEGDVFASAKLLRQGRRLIHAQAAAWQDDPAAPIARAHFVLRIG